MDGFGKGVGTSETDKTGCGCGIATGAGLVSGRGEACRHPSNGHGCGEAFGYGTQYGTGTGTGYAKFASLVVEGDDNILGLFYAKASFLPDLPSVGVVAEPIHYKAIVAWIRLASELGLAAIVTLSTEGIDISEVLTNTR